MATITVFGGTSGLNNIVDPARLKLDLETGVVELAEAVNVLIDQTGRPYRRPGRTLVAAGEYHSLFSDGGDCFVIQERAGDAAIMQIGADKVLTGIRSSLSKALRMGWCQVGGDTYYSNGHQNGIITDGISRAWAAQEHVGATTTRQFAGPPLGTQLFWFAGRMWIVDGRVLWHSEPFAYGKYDLARGFLLFGSDILMVKPVVTGFYLSDQDKTWFYEGTDPKELRPRVALDVPAHQYSAATGLVRGADIGLPDAGMCAVWSCDLGLCVGTASGTVLMPTRNKLNYPAGSQGASLIRDTIIINTVE